jgi:hypothetical protein
MRSQMALARHGLVVWGSLSLSLGACATMAPEESALRELMWGAATECARATSEELRSGEWVTEPAARVRPAGTGPARLSLVRS